jgi:hypothetical protein
MGRSTMVERTARPGGVLTRTDRFLAAALLAGALLAAASVPLPARAAEATAYARSDLQLYAVPNPYGTREMRRRRYTQTFGLTVTDLLGAEPSRGPELTFTTRMRLDTDLGQSSSLTDPSRDYDYVPGVDLAPVDVQYAYLDARGLGGDALALRVGRQYVVDALGWWSFDGARVTVRAPVPIELTGLVGYEPRDAVPLLATSRFTAEGVFRGSRQELEVNQWPSYLDARRVAPAVGFTLASHDLRWLDTELVYRRVEERDAVYVTLYPERGGTFDTLARSRVATEQLGGLLALRREGLGAVDGRCVYNLLRQRLSDCAGGLRWHAADPVTVSLGYDYAVPTFDGDSIFNWFVTTPMSTVEVGAELDLSRSLSLAPLAGVRTFGAPQTDAGSVTAPDGIAATSAPSAADAFGNLTVQRRWSRGRVVVDAGADGGPDGHRIGTDAQVEQTFRDGFYDSLVVVSLHDWHDEWQPERDATSFTYVIGGGVHPDPASRLGVEWEHTANRLVGQRFRVLLSLQLEVGR